MGGHAAGDVASETAVETLQKFAPTSANVEDLGQAVINANMAVIEESRKAGLEGMTMAFLTLSMVEMFHSFNMRSRRQSIFSLKSQNKFVWGAFLLALALTFVVIEVPFFASAFGFAEISWQVYLTAMALAALIIPVVEIEKAVMRSRDVKRAEKN